MRTPQRKDKLPMRSEREAPLLNGAESDRRLTSFVQPRRQSQLISIVWNFTDSSAILAGAVRATSGHVPSAKEARPSSKENGD
jgi:hypothetical protein